VEELRAEDPRRVGPFELRARLGAGAMGQVFLGERADGVRAAVKVIYESLTAESSFRARFGHELEIARRVRAPWAAAVIDADVQAARPWFATEYVDGPSLRRAVADSGAIAEVATLAGQLAVALAELHALHVVHRDIKPSNVLLAGEGPKLIDFGIARAVDATRITHTGTVLGTPEFMSPEQAAGQEGGPASDVFSLAAVLVFAATGHGPFGQAANPMAMLYRVLHAAPDLTAVPEPLRTALAPCLAKDPAARPTAAQLAHQLTATAPTTTTTFAPPAATGVQAHTAPATSHHSTEPRAPRPVGPTGQSGGPMWWYVNGLREYAVFAGRAGRREYWLFTLVNTLVLAVLGVATGIGTTWKGLNPLLAGLLLVYALATAVPSLAIGVRRLHDSNRSGWWLLIGLVPLGGLVLLVFLAFEGTAGPNAYGPDPRVIPAGQSRGSTRIGLVVIGAVAILVGVGLGLNFVYTPAYHNAQDGYGFTPPHGWRPLSVSPSVGLSVLFGPAPVPGSTRPAPSLQVSVAPSNGEGLDHLTDGYRKPPPDTVNFQMTEDRPVTLSDGTNARLLDERYDLTARYRGTIRHPHVIFLFVVSGGKYYRAVCSVPEGTENYEAECRRSLLTFSTKG
jgi:uncharacterized membrane protein YhaH (DUF805 family)